MTEPAQASGLTRHYARSCDLRDFADPDVARAIADVAPRYVDRPPDRKAWEYAMGALFLKDTGHLDGGGTVLDVGAGADPILYWLANHTRRTVGIDIYGEGGFADREGELSMLSDPDSHAPFPYRRESLEVRHMDARELEFEDETFDAVVTFSSIEHFGGARGITAAAREIGRVLRPGGHAFIVTEAFVDYGLWARPAVQTAIRAATLGRRRSTATPRQRAWPEVLTVAELRRWIIEPSGLELMQPLRATVSAETREHVLELARDGTVAGGGSNEKGSHVLLAMIGTTFTSIGLPLVKPAG